MTNRVWFWHRGCYVHLPGPMDATLFAEGAQPTDAVAAGGNWHEYGDTISFSPGWCQDVTMRECQRMTFPDGTEERQSNNVGVTW